MRLARLRDAMSSDAVSSSVALGEREQTHSAVALRETTGAYVGTVDVRGAFETQLSREGFRDENAAGRRNRHDARGER